MAGDEQNKQRPKKTTGKGRGTKSPTSLYDAGRASNDPPTTGHEWDGITEFDNPDPRWLRLAFYCALFFSLAYWVLYPSWPTPHNNGLLGWTSYKELAVSQQEIVKLRSRYQEAFDKTSFAEIMASPELLRFAMVGGESAFANKCAVCHGAGGGGNPGYPNLTAGAWPWGGTIDEIYTTLQFGIRSGHEQGRESAMAAFGKDKVLTTGQIWQLVDYARGLYPAQQAKAKGGPAPVADAASTAAAALFQDNCASCHGASGEGNKEVGAPALNDAIWLYGGSRETIYDVICNGRAGVMPYWSVKLSDSTIRQLAVYVHQLGGGQ